LYFLVSTNIDEPTLSGLIVPLNGSIAGWIVNNRKPVRIMNVHEDPRFYSTIEAITVSNQITPRYPVGDKE